MQHREYKHIVEGADAAILMIHGITGSPNHFRHLVAMIPEGISVWNILLDGHGKGTSDFAHTSMEKWEKQVRCAVDELAATHRQLYIVGHSMGALFAICHGVRCSKIAGLFLLGVPIKVGIGKELPIYSWRLFRDNIRPDDAMGICAKEVTSIRHDRGLLHYLGWIPRYLELFQKIRQVRRLLPQLQTPGVAIQSGKDEMVSHRSAGKLRQAASLQVMVLENAYHYYYPEEDRRCLEAAFRAFLERIPVKTVKEEGKHGE